jgi:hypothetical protein
MNIMEKLSTGAIIIITTITLFLVASCDEQNSNGSRNDTRRQQFAGNTIQRNQPTPTDIAYSLERYNLIRRAYWVNGQRERARVLPCPVPNVPLGYIVLLSQGGAVVGKFVVSGKVSSLNSYLTPDSEYYSGGGTFNVNWLADVDGCYGSNDNGVFFFTPDGKYIEWNGVYLYSDIPFEVKDPVVQVAQTLNNETP